MERLSGPRAVRRGSLSQVFPAGADKIIKGDISDQQRKKLSTPKKDLGETTTPIRDLLFCLQAIGASAAFSCLFFNSAFLTSGDLLDFSEGNKGLMSHKGQCRLLSA